MNPIALLLIDIQNDYFPGGRMELHEPEKAALRASELLGFFRNRNQFIIHVRNEAIHPGASFLLPETPGVDFQESVLPLPGETVITKNYPNSFRDTKLEQILRKEMVQELYICGMMTHNCVSSTVRAAFDSGFTLNLIENACATRALKTPAGIEVKARDVQNSHIAALSRFAHVLSTEELLHI